MTSAAGRAGRAWTARGECRAGTALLARLRTSVGGGDAGSAVVEFLGASLLLLVPVVYLVLVLGRVQAATFAVDTAAREAARAAVTAEPAAAAARVDAAVALALADQGLPAGAAAVAVACEPRDCAGAGATVSVEVAVDVDLPGVPAFAADAVPLRVPVSAVVTSPVEAFRGRGAR